jgi:molybdopterin adenylyltransferase
MATSPADDAELPANAGHAGHADRGPDIGVDPRRRAVVVTASDGVASGHRQDGSGDAVALQLEGAGFTVVDRVVVPDDRATIADRLREVVDAGAAALVAITGGTGFGPRDVTPEATREVIDREAPGFAEAMRASGRASTPMADLSRGVCGVRGSTLLIDLPGSPRGATESLAAVLQLLPHAIDLLAGHTREHPAGHGEHGAPVG